MIVMSLEILGSFGNFEISLFFYLLSVYIQYSPSYHMQIIFWFPYYHTTFFTSSFFNSDSFHPLNAKSPHSQSQRKFCTVTDANFDSSSCSFQIPFLKFQSFKQEKANPKFQLMTPGFWVD